MRAGAAGLDVPAVLRVVVREALEGATSAGDVRLRFAMTSLLECGGVCRFGDGELVDRQFSWW